MGTNLVSACRTSKKATVSILLAIGLSAYIANLLAILLGFMAIDYQSSPFTTRSLYYQQVFSAKVYAISLVLF
jgi:hypothetical protein